jgi:hypothetical protein
MFVHAFTAPLLVYYVFFGHLIYVFEVKGASLASTLNMACDVFLVCIERL